MRKTNIKLSREKEDKTLTIEEQLRQFLRSSENTISIEEAIKEVNRKWPRSKHC